MQQLLSKILAALLAVMLLISPTLAGGLSGMNGLHGLHGIMGAGTVAETPPPGPTLLFSDTFPGSVLDTTKWISTLYWGADPPRNLGTGEIQTYDPSAVTVGSGKLVITATQSSGTPTDTGNKNASLIEDANDGTNVTNPGNIIASDNVRATVALTGATSSEIIYATAPDFSAIPDGATITGLDVIFEAHAGTASRCSISSALNDTSGIISDVDNFTLGTTSDTVTTRTNTTHYHGTLSSSVLKDSNFALLIRFDSTNTVTCNMDNVRFKAYYTATEYTSGIVSTYGKFSHQYGYIEISAKTPGGGSGHWPAFWFVSADHPDIWPPELDGAEWGANPNEVNVNVHWDNAGTPDENPLLIDMSPTNLSAGFHTYAVDWQADHIYWYIDGVLVHSTTDVSQIPDESLYLILNYAVGNPFWAFVGMPDGSSVWPGTYEIQSVDWYDVKP